MNISRIALIFALQFLTLSISGQKHKSGIVILNDGTTITGNIIADSSGYLKLKIKSPRVMILKKSQNYTAVSSGNAGTLDRHGYSLTLSASLLAGRNSNGNTANPGIKLLNSYRFRNGLSLGIGTGIEKLDVLLIPAYADLRFHPFKTRVSPYIWVSSGYGFPCSNREDGNYYLYDYYGRTRGGMMFNAGSGITINSWERFSVTTGIGYRYQRIGTAVNYLPGGETNRELITDFNRVELLFGVIFR